MTLKGLPRSEAVTATICLLWLATGLVSLALAMFDGDLTKLTTWYEALGAFTAGGLGYYGVNKYQTVKIAQTQPGVTP